MAGQVSRLAVWAEAAPQQGLLSPPMLLTLVAIAILFFFIVWRPESQQRKQRQRMIDQLKKNDRVMTIGGIYGVVANAKPGEPEVVIKVDESTGTKLRVARTHIANVVEVAESQENAKAAV